MPNLFIYTTPAASTVTLTLDSGQPIDGGAPLFANGRNDAHCLTVPTGTTGGALLEVTCTGKVGFANRGLVIPPSAASGEAHFQLDDVRLPDVPVPDVPLPPNPNQDPFALIRAVYEQHEFDLATKDGCGTYVEACVDALHTQHSEQWGHIRKQPAQNQWQGHAIDALQLLGKAGETSSGIYDIILDTESPNAQPAWSYKGVSEPELFYYGPMPCPQA